jgi:hypothetical protein
VGEGIIDIHQSQLTLFDELTDALTVGQIVWVSLSITPYVFGILDH